ncbi:MAG: PTS sugar transporter subunit IIC [Christensenella sp.]|nr:PTS sugar transporter subunit IIC [Christensenella sp.]
MEKNVNEVVENGQQINNVEDVVLTPQAQTKKELKVWEIVKKLSKRWFIDAFTGMSLGLFATLIAGTILCTIAKIFNADSKMFYLLNTIGSIAKSLMGVGIGVGIAFKLKAKPLVIFTAALAGFVGAFSNTIIASTFVLALGAPGNPIGAYIVALMAIEIANLYAGKTKFDIILIPLGMMIIMLAGVYVAWPFIWLINKLGVLIAAATKTTPFFMGIIIAVIVGILLTMPTSSAAIWVAVAGPVLTGFAAGNVSEEYYNAMLLAGGAATVGCACQMVGFAVMSFKENGFSGLISQGLGTSMLQIPNIMKNGWTFVPPIVASAICGPLSTCLFKLKCGSAGGGMGTSGLVGCIDVISTTGSTALSWIGVILLMFVLPAVISFAVCLLLRKTGKIKDNDLLLPIE